jgi:hypothetical protein
LVAIHRINSKKILSLRRDANKLFEMSVLT